MGGPDVILLAVRWYLSYRDLEELLAERGVQVDHVTLFRWVQRFTPMLAEAARPCRHAVGDRWFVDETYVKVAGVWRCVYRSVDQHGQVIDVMVSNTLDIAEARKFFVRAMGEHGRPRQVITDLAAPLLRDRRPLARGRARDNQARQQPGRVRSGPAQSAAATDWRPEDRQDRRDRGLRRRFNREPPTRSLATRR